MLKITQHNNANASIIRLEGTLHEAWIGEVRSALDGALRDGKRIRMDLLDLTFADGPGIALLRELLASGAELVACSSFVAASLGMEKP